MWWTLFTNSFTSADDALSTVAAFDFEISWWKIKCSISPNLHIAQELKIGIIKKKFWGIYVARCKWNSFNINRSLIWENTQSVNGPINLGSLAEIYIFFPSHASWTKMGVHIHFLRTVHSGHEKFQKGQNTIK